MRPRSKCPANKERARRTEIALLTVKEIFELVSEDLVKVEQELSRQSASAYQPVSEITSYLLGGGGKRLRPALLLLAHGYAARSEGDSRSAIKLPAVLQLLHNPTLPHKPACLSRGCPRLGGVLGGRDEEHEPALADYGRYSGLAFQLVDDLLDFTASSEQLGKPVLSDLKEGKVTLPLIYAMENGHSEAREMVARVLEEKEFDSVQPETLVPLVRDSGALDPTRNLSLDYAVRAKACLNGSGFSEYARALQTLPDFILDRES